MQARTMPFALALVLAGCDGTGTETVEAAVARSSETASAPVALTGTYLFGHQSVGANLIQGIEELPAGWPKPAVVELAAAGPLDGPGIHHLRLGENGSPESKLEAFAAALEQGASPDVALMKFCYIDVTAETDPDELFEKYRAQMEAIRRAHPDVQLVHVTLPLTADRGTLRHWRTVLRGDGEQSQRHVNAIRHRYNELLRAEFEGREPVFDLARLESTLPGGEVETVRYDGARVPVLAAQYTTDGGHLNEAGRRRAAQALLETLSTL